MPLPENYPAGLQRHLQHFASLLTVCPQPTTNDTAPSPTTLPGALAGPSLQDFFPGLVVLSTLAALPDWKLASTPYESGDGLWVATLDISDPESRESVFRLTASYGDDKSQRTLQYQTAPHEADQPVELLGKAFPNRGVLTGWLTACVERVVAQTRADAYAAAGRGKEAAESHLSELAKALTQIKVADRILYWGYDGNSASVPRHAG